MSRSRNHVARYTIFGLLIVEVRTVNHIWFLVKGFCLQNSILCFCIRQNNNIEYKLVAGHISWKLNTKPAVFGKDVQLSCHLTSNCPCCSDYTRKWAKGWKYNLAIVNGVSLNILKYREFLNNSANTSILTKRIFQEDDVNIPYECTYGF